MDAARAAAATGNVETANLARAGSIVMTTKKNGAFRLRAGSMARRISRAVSLITVAMRAISAEAGNRSAADIPAAAPAAIGTNGAATMAAMMMTTAIIQAAACAANAFQAAAIHHPSVTRA